MKKRTVIFPFKCKTGAVVLEVFFFFSSVCKREEEEILPFRFLSRVRRKWKKVYKVDKKGRYIYIYRIG